MTERNKMTLMVIKLGTGNATEFVIGEVDLTNQKQESFVVKNPTTLFMSQDPNGQKASLVNWLSDSLFKNPKECALFAKDISYMKEASDQLKDAYNAFVSPIIQPNSGLIV